MNRHAHRALILISLTLGLAACTSAPVHFYTLLAPPAKATTAEQPAPFFIDVLPVGVPAHLDQPQMVVRQGESRVLVLDGERWAGPLGDEMRSALSAELSRHLDTQDMAGLVPPPGKPVLRIKLQVRRLDAWPGQHVQFDADWSLGFADDPGNARRIGHGHFEEPAAGGYAELVLAHQRTIAALAARLATEAREWAVTRKKEKSKPLP